MEKRLILFLTAVLISATLRAQYIPHNSQGYQLMPLFNPAFTGVESYNDMKLSYRYQWSGFGENAPRFINLSYHKRIKQPLNMNYNSQRLSTSSLQEQQVPRGKQIIHGLGANIFQSGVGVLESIGGSVDYAFNYPLSKTARLAFGGSAVIENRKLDVRKITLRDPDEFYNYLLRSSTSQTDLNVRAGVLVYGQNFYFGASYYPLVNIALQSSELAMEQPFYRGSLQTGLSFPLSPEASLKPSILALLQMNNKWVIDYNVKTYIQNKVFFGLSYRSIKSGVALLGFNINERFTASYSFEMSVGDFNKFDDGSHELVLAARFNNIRRFTQFTW